MPHTNELHNDCPWTIAWMLSWLYADKNMTNRQNLLDQVNAILGPNALPPNFDWDDISIILNRRAEWYNYVLLYRTAAKYDISKIQDITRNALKTELASTPSLASDIAGLIGSVTFSSDAAMCKILMEAWFKEGITASEVHTKVETIFDHNLAASNAARDYIFTRLSASERQNKQYLESISRATDRLHAMNPQVQQIKNVALKDKFKEISEYLEDAQRAIGNGETPNATITEN